MDLYKDEETGLKHLKLNASGKILDVPGCLLYSHGGMVPHLTDENLGLVNNHADKLWHLPLSSIYEQPGPEIMETFSGTFHEFSSSEDKVWILCTNDSYNPKQEMYTYNEEKSISIWAPSGRRKITPQEYMRIMEIFSFDIAIAPSDTIPSGSTKKRCRKSVERTQRFLDKCLKIKEEKKLTMPLLGVVEGGDSIVFREKSAKDLASKNVDGYVLGGFDRITWNWKELLEISLKHLNDDSKAKIIFGILTPFEVVEAIDLGMDVFDTVIAYYLTERGCALNFSFTKIQNDMSVSLVDERNTKRAKREEIGDGCKDLHQFEMNLTDKRYFNDDQPLVPGCQCYCCIHHVRAYLHHLLVTKEMLASVLLMMHNLSYWLEFFKEIRKSIQEKKFNEFKKTLYDLNT